MLALSSLVHSSMTATCLPSRDFGTLPAALPSIGFPISGHNSPIHLANIARVENGRETPTESGFEPNAVGAGDAEKVHRNPAII